MYWTYSLVRDPQNHSNCETFKFHPCMGCRRIKIRKEDIPLKQVIFLILLHEGKGQKGRNLRRVVFTTRLGIFPLLVTGSHTQSVSTAGLSRGGFTLKGGIGSVWFSRELVEKIHHSHTNLMLRESLEVYDKVWLWIICTHTYFLVCGDLVIIEMGGDRR